MKDQVPIRCRLHWHSTLPFAWPVAQFRWPGTSAVQCVDTPPCPLPDLWTSSGGLEPLLSSVSTPHPALCLTCGPVQAAWNLCCPVCQHPTLPFAWPVAQFSRPGTSAVQCVDTPPCPLPDLWPSSGGLEPLLSSVSTPHPALCLTCGPVQAAWNLCCPVYRHPTLPFAWPVAQFRRPGTSAVQCVDTPPCPLPDLWTSSAGLEPLLSSVSTPHPALCLTCGPVQAAWNLCCMSQCTDQFINTPTLAHSQVQHLLSSIIIIIPTLSTWPIIISTLTPYISHHCYCTWPRLLSITMIVTIMLTRASLISNKCITQHVVLMFKQSRHILYDFSSSTWFSHSCSNNSPNARLCKCNTSNWRIHCTSSLCCASDFSLCYFKTCTSFLQ